MILTTVIYLYHRSQRPADKEKLNKKLLFFPKRTLLLRENFKLNFQYEKKSSLEGIAIGNRIADVYFSNYIRAINDQLSNQILLLVDITEISVFKDDEFSLQHRKNYRIRKKIQQKYIG